MRFQGNAPVDVLPIGIAPVDQRPVSGRFLVVTGHHQRNRRMSARMGCFPLFATDFHPARRINSGSDLKDDVVDRDVVLLQAADLDDREKSLARVFVETFKTVKGQDSVFPHQRHDVRGDTHHHQVQQVFHLREGQSFVPAIGLHQLKTDPTPRKFLERIITIGSFGVQHRDRFGNTLPGQMVVTDDKIDPPLSGIRHFFGGFDPAVERNNQADASFPGIINRFVRHPVAFGITIRNVEQDPVMPLRTQKRVQQRNRGCTVHIIVSINHDGFALMDRPIDAVDHFPHIFHQEGVMEVFQSGIKELPCFFVCFNATLNK